MYVCMYEYMYVCIYVLTLRSLNWAPLGIDWMRFVKVAAVSALEKNSAFTTASNVSVVSILPNGTLT